MQFNKWDCILLPASQIYTVSLVNSFLRSGIKNRLQCVIIYITILPSVQKIYWMLYIQTLLYFHLFTPLLARVIGILTFDISQIR